jgi:hypothetical protein
MIEHLGHASREMLSRRSRKDYAKEVQSAARIPTAALATNGATAENDLEAVVGV